MKRFLALGIGAALALSAGTSSVAHAHGGGVLRVASKQVARGGTISMTGEKLGNNANLKAELRGVLDNYALGSVRTAATGALAASITVPVAVPAGVFTLVLIADDGDVAGRTEVTVGPLAAAAAAASGMPHMAAGGEMADMPGMRATAEMMKIEISTTPVEWAIIGALIIISFAGGAALLAKSRSTRAQ